MCLAYWVGSPTQMIRKDLLMRKESLGGTGNDRLRRKSRRRRRRRWSEKEKGEMRRKPRQEQRSRGKQIEIRRKSIGIVVLCFYERGRELAIKPCAEITQTYRTEQRCCNKSVWALPRYG